MTRPRTGNDLTTPLWFVNRVRRIGPIIFDPCGNEWSEVQAWVSCNLDEGQDGLDRLWPLNGLIYCNPPYGRGELLKWSRKVAVEAIRGTEIVMLVPTASTKWSALLAASMRVKVDLAKRISFGGGKHGSGMFDSTVWYCGPSPYLFAHHFADLGEVRVYDR